MADSILDTVNAAYEDLSSPEAPPPAAEAPEVEVPPAAEETDDQKAARARDEAGRFAKQPKEAKRETLKLKEKPQEQGTAYPKSAVPTPPSQAAPAAPIVEKIAAPQEWSGLAKVKWDRLPVDVQKEIAQHEQTRMTATADLMPVKELFDANREFLVNQAGSVSEAMRQMMQFARMSVDNPVQLAEHILRSKGIDPRAAFSGQPQAPQGPQDIQALLAQLVDQRLQPVLAQREQEQTQQLQTTINDFSRRPDRPFFNDVRVHMGQLIEAGAAKSLDEAYDQATWANPTIRAHLLNEQREATDKAKAEQVQKARTATRASVTGSPLNGAMPAGGGPKGNIRDVVREAYEDMETR